MNEKQLQQSNTSLIDYDRNPTLIWIHGLAAMGDEQWKTAIESFQLFLQLVTTAKDRQMAYQNLCTCYLGLTDYDHALAILDQAEGEPSADPEIIHNRAMIYCYSGQIAEASKLLEYFGRRHPNLAKRQNINETLKMLRKIQQGKLTPGTFLVDLLQNQVVDNIDMEEFALVEEKGQRMIAADAKRPEGHFAVGISALHLGHYQTALDAFTLAASLNPRNVPTITNIAYVYDQLGNQAEAIEWNERVLKLDPKHLTALHRLGKIYQQMGEIDKAVTFWQKAIQIQSDFFPALNSLFEVGKGPQPAKEPPLPANYYERERVVPIVKRRMRKPQVFRNGSLTLTYDPQVGFILEDTDNKRNGTIHAGGPFKVGEIRRDVEILDLMGFIKLLLTMINAENTRDIAVLIYYANGTVFNYVAQFKRGKRVYLDTHNRFLVNEVPKFFKLRIDSDLDTPYGTPMQGILIYLNQGQKPGKLISTLGLGKQ